jgi:sarcosine oxidase subunit beta
MFDVAVIGGGIIGASAAAFMAEAGTSVVLFEQSAIGAGASGRNSGAIQHPYDVVLGELHRLTLPLYRELADSDPDFSLPADPDGLLLVSTDADATEAAARAMTSIPVLAPRFVSAHELAELEPAIAPDVCAVELATGYAVVPASATQAFARRARRAGAEIRVGEPALPLVADGRAVGVAAGSSQSVGAGMVLACGGPWSIDIVPGWRARPPISRSWGVVATIELARRPRRILEELSIDASGSAEPVAFSLMTAGGATSLGSTFLADEPEPATQIDALRERAATFVPELAEARVTGLRSCARPLSFDGRPLIGPVVDVEGLFVCAGHGPWGISTGPASARLVVDAMLNLGRVAIPTELAASRYAAG